MVDALASSTREEIDLSYGQAGATDFYAGFVERLDELTAVIEREPRSSGPLGRPCNPRF
jgi:hypothetical protein